MVKEFEIFGCVEVQPSLTEDEFYDIFIRFVEENGWTFGGGVRTIVDGFYLNTDGTKGSRVFDE